MVFPPIILIHSLTHLLPKYYFEGVCLVDTTVILAQPRVPRLRGDAVYVDYSGSTGLPRISWIYKRPLERADPPKIAQIVSHYRASYAKKM